MQLLNSTYVRGVTKPNIEDNPLHLVGGDMARDTYEMTSPMHVLSYGLGVAKYIPPTEWAE